MCKNANRKQSAIPTGTYNEKSCLHLPTKIKQMKKIIFLFICASVCVAGFSQESVTIHGPYEPNGKYISEETQGMNLSIQIVGDSSVLNMMEKKNLPTTMPITNHSQSKILITTGKINDDGRFNISAENRYTTRFNYLGKVDSSDHTLMLYGFAKRDEIPHYDSIQFVPEVTGMSDSVKAVLAKMFQNIGGIQFPHKEFRIGDTASMNITMPLQILTVNENIFVTQIFKLTKIENGLAEFDISVLMKFGMMGDSTMPMQGEGTGDGSGKVVYDINNHYFKSTNLQMDYVIPTSMDVQDKHIEMQATGKTNSSTNTSYQPN
jgi:hypothetical protein